MEQVTIAGAIPPLVRLLSPPGGVGGAGKKAKGKKKAALPPAVELGIQNAAGALRHLTFYDPSVRMIVEAGGIKVRLCKRAPNEYWRNHSPQTETGKNEVCLPRRGSSTSSPVACPRTPQL